MGKNKKYLMQNGLKKKKLNAKLERHMVRPHTLSHEVFAYIYIYIYIDIILYLYGAGP